MLTTYASVGSVIEYFNLWLFFVVLSIVDNMHLMWLEILEDYMNFVISMKIFQHKHNEQTRKINISHHDLNVHFSVFYN